MEIPNKTCFNKVSKSIEVMYKSRNIIRKRLKRQKYFTFTYNHLNYANIASSCTNKSNLISLYRHQKLAIRIIYDKDCFAHTKPFCKHVKALTVYEINLFQILPMIFKSKTRTTLFVFYNL